MGNWACIAVGSAILLAATIVTTRLGQQSIAAANVSAAAYEEPVVPASAPRPWIAAEFTDTGRLLVTGQVPDQATRDRLLALALELHPAESIDMSVRVDPVVARMPWLESHVAFLALAPYGQRRSNLDGTVLTLEGVVETEEERAMIGELAEQASAGAVEVKNLVRVRTP